MDEVVAWVELLGVTFAGAEEPDAGLIWSDLEGWWGLPDSRGEADLIPGEHGRFKRSKVLREARVLTLSGAIYAADNFGLVEARTRLEAALAEGIGSMRVATAASGVWERWVEIDTLTIAPDHGRRWTTFTIDMLAPDPRRYGPEQVVGPVGLPVSTGGVRLPQRMPWNFGTVSEQSRLLVPNSGAIKLHPFIDVSGGFNTVSVVDITSGRRLSLNWQVPEGSTLVLDSGARRATVDGSDVTRWLTRRQWFEIPAGETHEFRFEVSAPNGSPEMRARFRNGAW